MVVANAYRRSDLSNGIDLVTKFLDLEQPVTGSKKG